VVDGVVASVAAADRFTAKVYDKCLSGGTQRIVHTLNIEGAQSGNLVTPWLPLLHGWDMTLIKGAGSDRSMTASIRKAA
jgi:hypothetical protein